MSLYRVFDHLVPFYLLTLTLNLVFLNSNHTHVISGLIGKKNKILTRDESRPYPKSNQQIDDKNQTHS